jgi:hypothetical protein
MIDRGLELLVLKLPMPLVLLGNSLRRLLDVPAQKILVIAKARLQ